jgi:S-adenosylmethionine/arginine decarboxylase-like enzyme
MLQHKHLLLKGTIKNVPNKSDSFQMKLWIKRFIISNQMKMQEEPIVSYVHDKGNRGMTACCLLKTSHMAFHIWDEQNPALIQFDFYTCGKLNVAEVIKKLSIKFHFITFEYMVLNRESGIKTMVKEKFTESDIIQGERIEDDKV